MSRRRLSIGLGAYALDKVVVAIIQIAMIPVLANAWGLTLYGIWAIAMTIPGFLVLGDFGIVNSAAARMIRFVARDEWDEARRALHTAWLVTISIVSVAVTAIAVLIWRFPDGVVPTASGFPETDSRLMLLILLVYGLSSILFRLNTAAYRAALFYTLSSLCSTGVYLIENLVVLALVLSGFGPVAAAIGLLAVRLVSIVILFLISHRLVPRLKPGFTDASMTEWHALWRPALAASALGFGVAAYLQGSVVLLGAIAGAAAVPAFIAVRTLSRLGVQVATLVSLPVSQEFGNALARGDMFRAGRYFGLVAVSAAVMAGTAGLGLVLIGAPFVRVWTHDAIVADQSLIVFMAISSFAAMFWNPLSNLILVINRQQAFSYANLAASALGLALIWAAAGRFGAVAVGLSFALVDTLTLVAVLLFVWRNWLLSADFLRGITSSGQEMRSPLAMIRSRRRAT